jgi:hypothetical protein
MSIFPPAGSGYISRVARMWPASSTISMIARAPRPLALRARRHRKLLVVISRVLDGTPPRALDYSGRCIRRNVRFQPGFVTAASVIFPIQSHLGARSGFHRPLQRLRHEPKSSPWFESACRARASGVRRASMCSTRRRCVWHANCRPGAPGKSASCRPRDLRISETAIESRMRSVGVAPAPPARYARAESQSGCAGKVILAAPLIGSLRAMSARQIHRVRVRLVAVMVQHEQPDRR